MTAGRRFRPFETFRHPVVPGVGAALALTMISSGPAAAQDGKGAIALPLEAPAGADAFVAEFVELCSIGVLDVAKGREAAISRRWKTGAPNDGAAGRKAPDAYSGEKIIGSGIAVVSMTTTSFPDLVVRGCELHATPMKGPAIEPSAIGRIEGLRGGFGSIADVPEAGFWSLVDREDAVVTVGAVPAGGEVTFSMSRSVRAEPAAGGAPKNSQPAR